MIVVDDGSEDDTAERLASIDGSEAARHPARASHGVARARNAGIEAARGRLGQLPRRRRRLVAAQAAGAARRRLGRRRRLRLLRRGGAGRGPKVSLRRGTARPGDDRAPAPALERHLVRLLERRCENRRSSGSSEGSTSSLFQLADWDLWIRLALAGRAAAVPEIHVGYVMHADSMLLTHRRDVFPEFEYLAQKHAEAQSGVRHRVRRALFSRWVARGHRRAGRNREAAQVYLGSARRHRDPGAALRALAALLPEPAIRLGSRLTLASSVAQRSRSWLCRSRTGSRVSSSEQREGELERHRADSAPGRADAALEQRIDVRHDRHVTRREAARESRRPGGVRDPLVGSPVRIADRLERRRPQPPRARLGRPAAPSPARSSSSRARNGCVSVWKPTVIPASTSR